MKPEKILLRDMEKRDKRTFSMWLKDVDVVKFLIDMFKVSRMSENVLNIPFGKNRKIFILQTNDGDNIGFCGLYNINWQLKRCSLYVYIDNCENVNDDLVNDAMNSIVKSISLLKKFKILEVHTKADILKKYIDDINNVRKCDNEYVFEIGLSGKIG